MLEFIRNRAQSWIAGVIVALIIIPFALWGIGDYFTGDSETGVAVVNGEKISQDTFQRAFAQQREQMREMLGKRYDAATHDEMIRKDVINNLVNQELLYQTSQDQGLSISDAMLAQIIHSFKEFQLDGKFDKALYERTLSAQGMSPAYFEYQMRRSMLSQQFYAGLANSPVITDYEIENLLRLMKQQRNVAYVAIPRSKYLAGAAVTPDEIQKYYQAHQEDFMTPEQVSLEYLELSASELAKGVELSEAKLKEAYDTQKHAYAPEEQRRVSHILLEAANDAPADVVNAAKAKAEDLLAKIKAGGDFAALAKANSDDPGSADFGGSLGLIKRGEMVPEFDKVAFSLAQGEVSSVVRTDFGFHIIKVDEIKGGEVPTFEAVRERLAQDVKNQEAEKLFFARAETLGNLTYEHPESLERAAEELKLSIQETGLFPRDGGPGIAANAAVISAAFSEDVLKEGLNSQVIELGTNHVAVIRVKEHKPQELRPLTELSESIGLKLKNDKADQQAENLGREIAAALSGAGADALLKQNGLQWSELGVIGREATAGDPAVIAEAFRMAPPAAGKVSVGSVRTAGGDFVVIRVTEVKYPDAGTIDNNEKEAMKRTLASTMGNQEYLGYLNGLKANAKIVVRAE
ncbi:MAG: SurA N-terminal domain-containing protein [Pseudomonadota bacterium]